MCDDDKTILPILLYTGDKNLLHLIPSTVNNNHFKYVCIVFILLILFPLHVLLIYLPNVKAVEKGATNLCFTKLQTHIQTISSIFTLSTSPFHFLSFIFTLSCSNLVSLFSHLHPFIHVGLQEKAKKEKTRRIQQKNDIKKVIQNISEPQLRKKKIRLGVSCFVIKTSLLVLLFLFYRILSYPNISL